MIALALALGAPSCGGSSSSGGEGARAELPLAPAPDPEAAARAFRLFYRERVHRAVLAFNRFAVFGDAVAATVIGSKAIARTGDDYEVVPGPTDNNLIGTSVLALWNAYRVFGTRELELSLIRTLEGLAFLEEVPGIPGLTSREVLPGWTRVMDGRARRVTRTRDGRPVTPPRQPDAALEEEILATFYDGIRVTYREDPGEYLFAFKPIADLEDYAITSSFDERPRYLRVSNCCSSFMRTPEGRPWAGAWWGNHNSRDNLPDLALGFLAAMDVARHTDASPELRRAAERAVAAGTRIGDAIEAAGGNLMTVDEFHPYGELTVGGARRPHGEPENQDLGSMAACPMAYLARALSRGGLDVPVPEIPLPGAIEQLLLRDLLGLGGLGRGYERCTDLDQAYFGETFASQGRGEIFGVELLDVIALLDRLSPGLAGDLIGGFQNDYDDVVESTSALVLFADVTGRPALAAEAREALAGQVRLQREFADTIYGRIEPERRAAQRYEAAIFETRSGLGLEDPGDLGDLAIADRRIAALEELLAVADTAPWPLIDDEEIRERIEARLAGEKLDSVVARYRAAYGDTPPVRRAGDGYEARTSIDPTYRPVERPHHRLFGGHVLLEEIALCVAAPEILDCRWARLGCAVADLDASGHVDAGDATLHRQLRARFGGASCGARNGWCDGADLDRTGTLDELDDRFLEAATGCQV